MRRKNIQKIKKEECYAKRHQFQPGMEVHPERCRPSGCFSGRLAGCGSAAHMEYGKEAVYHEGGYSIFRADVTDLCRTDADNLLVINCSNEYKDSVYPQSADFTFYGGLYRGVNLISVPNTHFDLDYFGGPGVAVTPKPCDWGGAIFELNSYVTNPDENFTVLYSILDAEGNEVEGGCRQADAPEVSLYVTDSRLWVIDDPYLYDVKAKLE